MQIGRVRELWRYPAKSMAGERLDAARLGPGGITGDRGWALRDDTTREITGAKRLPRVLECAARYRHEPEGDGTAPIDVTLPDGTRVASDAADVHTRLSAVLGRPVSLWPRRPASDRDHYRRAQPGGALVGRLARTERGRRWLQRIMATFGMDAALRAEFGREADEPMPDLSALPGELFEFTSPLGTYFDAFPLHVLTTASLDTLARANPAAAWDARRFRPNVLVETAPGVSGLVEAEWRGRTLRIGEVAVRCELPTVRCSMTMAAQGDLPKDPSILRTIVRDAAQHLGVYATAVGSGAVRVGDPVTLE